MMTGVEQVWDGVTRSATLSDWAAKARHDLADRARRYDWPGVFAVLAEHPRFVNTARPDGRSWYAPLHQAAHGGAPAEVIDRLVEMGAWRSLRTAGSERAVDIARRREHVHLLALLEPRPVIDVPADELTLIQGVFHDVIRGRAEKLVEEYRLRLPELEVLAEIGSRKVWFTVPGMYGGFSFWFDGTGSGSRLVSESWCRVAGGSGQRHEITAQGARLVDEGFV
jgi:hypothetical protein